jgi:outer membrane protein TolC
VGGKKNKRDMKKIFLIVFSVLIFQAKAQQQDDYIKIAAENNPALKSKYNQYLAALERVPQVGALPDPELSFGFFLRPMERYMGNQVGDISLMQMFPWFGTLDAARSEAALMAKMKYEEFREERNRVVYEVKQSYFELYRLGQEKKFLQENLEILESFENLALTRFKTGGEVRSGGQREPIRSEKRNQQPQQGGGMGGMNMGGGQSGTSSPQGMGQMRSGMQEMGAMQGGTGMVDVLRVQMQIKETQNELLLIEHSIRIEKVKFNNLLNKQITEPITIADTLEKAAPPLSMQATLDTILLRNPMVKMSEFEEGAYEAMERMQKRMGYPMIGVGANYMMFNPRPGGESHMNGMNMFMPMVSVSLPIYRRKYAGATREAAILKESAIEQRKQAINDLKLSFTEIAEELKHEEHRMMLYMELTQMSEQAWNVLTTEYKTAGKDFEEVLRMRQQLLQYNIEKINSIIRYNTAIAMLESLMAE